jgi:uncharacterized membrane protein required for colicin V production
MVLSYIIFPQVAWLLRLTPLFDFIYESVDRNLNMEGFAAYHAAGIQADLAVNGIAIIVVFAIVMVILSVVGTVLDIIGRLPVINTFNKIGGFLVGIIMGVGVSWLVMVGVAVFFAASDSPDVYNLIQNSFLAQRVFGSLL